MTYFNITPTTLLMHALSLSTMNITTLNSTSLLSPTTMYNSTIYTTSSPTSNTTNNLTNNNSTSSLPDDNMQLTQQILLCGYVLLFLIGTGGNTLVIFVFRHSLTKGPNIDMLILLLAICDLASSIISPLLLIYWILENDHWYLGEVACKIIPTLSRILMDISIGILLIMAIDRCRAIVTPLKLRFSRSFVLKLCALNVILSVMGQMYYYFSLKISKDTRCNPSDIRIKTFYIPLLSLLTIRTLVFMFIFWLTTVAIRKALNRSSSITTGSEINMVRRTKATKMIVLMAIVFTLTITPRDLLHILYTMSQTILNGYLAIPYTSQTKILNKALRWLSVSNCSYNVFIYGKMNSTFVHNLKKMFQYKNGLTRKMKVAFKRKDTQSLYQGEVEDDLL